MATNKTMTLNLTEQEMAVLEQLAEEKGFSKTALMRQALRLYQAIDAKQKTGWSLETRLVDENGESVTKMVIL